MSNIKARISYKGMQISTNRTSMLLRNHPLIRHVGNGRAEIFVAPEFVSPLGCEHLIALIDAYNRPSTVAHHNGDYAFRTSTTCDMDARNPVVESVQDSICKLMGIDRAKAEPIQGQKYIPGQEFKAHTDTFEKGTEEYEIHCGKSGQRTWTAMAYLDEPAMGGHTIFPHLDLDIKPHRGMLVMWNNLLPNGEPNPATLHHATPVISGEKHVITQWMRQKNWA
jgi:prolyl 4-hydroxylase